MASWGLVEWIAYSCRRFRVDKLLIESKASGITVAQEMRRLYSEDDWDVELVPVTGDKVARTHAVAPLFSHGLVYAPDISWADKLITQSELFPRDDHDDMHDSMTQALFWLRKNRLLSHDFESAAEEREQMMHKSKEKPLYEA
jgi:predicted phage terminase large subunit-like protein